MTADLYLLRKERFKMINENNVNLKIGRVKAVKKNCEVCGCEYFVNDKFASKSHTDGSKRCIEQYHIMKNNPDWKGGKEKL
jgi:hypothetical protein